MNSEQMRYARRGFERIFEDDGYSGDTLDRLVEKCMGHLVNVSTFQPSKPEAPSDPRIAMIERVWGCRVPADIRESLIADLGDATEDQLRAARIDWIKKNPRNRDAFTAVSWAKYSGKDNRSANKPTANNRPVLAARDGRERRRSVYSKLISDAAAD